VPADLAERLRAGRPAVAGRVEQGRCLLDLRCVPADDDAALVAALRAAAGPGGITGAAGVAGG
jgi:L-seryl-tRNA(Ser) seleniumtransferase